MNRNIDYIIDEDSAGLRVEQFLRRKRYSGQNLSEIKRMPKSILVNGVTLLYASGTFQGRPPAGAYL